MLGGTTEASALARRLAQANYHATFSYAGRTNSPVPQPLPTRHGGFGGVAGLASYLANNAITHVIDATHPFAAEMSLNAATACMQTGTALIRFTRAPWAAGPGDAWRNVTDLKDAARKLPDPPSRVFLAIGKQHLNAFATRPEHFYLLRLVDPPADPLPFPNCAIEVARGPFDVQADIDLLTRYRISHIVAKNSGGSGAYAKLAAARLLGVPVYMIDRPQLPMADEAHSISDVMHWLTQSAHHSADLGA